MIHIHRPPSGRIHHSPLLVFIGNAVWNNWQKIAVGYCKRYPWNTSTQTVLQHAVRQSQELGLVFVLQVSCWAQGLNECQANHLEISSEASCHALQIVLQVGGLMILLFAIPSWLLPCSSLHCCSIRWRHAPGGFWCCFAPLSFMQAATSFSGGRQAAYGNKRE